MDRKILKNFTLRQLQQKVRSYNIENIPNTHTRSKCIEVILKHLEQNNPLPETRDTIPLEATSETQSPSSAAQIFDYNNTLLNSANTNSNTWPQSH